MRIKRKDTDVGSHHLSHDISKSWRNYLTNLFLEPKAQDKSQTQGNEGNSDDIHEQGSPMRIKDNI